MPAADIAKLTEMARRDPHLGSFLADQDAGYLTQDSVARALANEAMVKHLSLLVEGHLHRAASHWADAKIGTTPAKTIQVKVLAEGLVRRNPTDWGQESVAPAGAVSGTVKASYRQWRRWEYNDGQRGQDLGSSEIPFTMAAGATSTVVEVERKFPDVNNERDKFIHLDLTLADLKAEGDSRSVQAGSVITMDDGFTSYTVRSGSQKISLGYADDAS